MKKFLAFVGTSVLLLAPINAVAAVKAGAACTKAGSTSTVGGKKYTCIKSGKKLVWDKGVTVTPPKSSTPAAPSSIADLEQNYAGVSYWAWKKSAQTIESSVSKAPKLTVLIGPHSKPLYEIPQVAVSQVSRMFPNYKEAKEFVLIYYNFQDVAWAEEKFNGYIGANGGYDTTNEVKKMCPGEKNCNGASAVRNQVTGIAVTLITASEYERTVKRFIRGTIEAHEYSHTIQNEQLFGTGRNNNLMPRWLVEGSASFIENAAINYDSFDKFKIDKASLMTELLYRKEFNEGKLIQFLDAPSLGKDWSSWDSYSPQRVYDIGMLVSEIMVSIKGPEVIMEQFKLVADGMSYQQAFEKSMGISWADGVKIISKVLAKQIS